MQVDPAIAMVATSSTRLPNASDIVAACSQKESVISRLLGALTGRKAKVHEVHEWEDQNLIFPFGDSQVAVSLMPAPIPWSQLEGPCATTWRWPEATEKMRKHTNHFLVAILGGSMPAVERRILLTRLVSAVVSTTDAIGIYWGEGTVVHEPEEFLELARSAKSNDIPGPLWLDVRVELNEDGSYRCFTTGMAPLGFLEIEVQKSSLEPDELMEFIGDTACYIVNSRQHIPAGNTMGRSATEQFVVHHSPSMFDRPNVMQLVMK